MAGQTGIVPSCCRCSSCQIQPDLEAFFPPFENREMPTSDSWHAILVAVTASGLDVGALKAHAISQGLVTALDVNVVAASVEPASALGAELTAAKAVRSACSN